MVKGKEFRGLISCINGFEKKFDTFRSNFSYPIDFPNIDFSEQFKGWNNHNYKRAPANVYSGRFFEELGISIFGGTLNDSIHMFYEDYQIKPDIKFGENKFGEVKSCLIGLQLKLEKEQLAKMALLLIKNGLPSLDFILFQHGLVDIQKDYQEKDKLIKGLKKEVLYCIRVPIQFPMQFFIHPDQCKKYKLKEYPPDKRGNRGYGDKNILSISSKFMPSLLFNPNITLQEIGLNLKDYIFQRYTVSNLKVNKKKISQFPLLVIKSKKKKYEEWFNQERSNLSELADYFVSLEEKKKVGRKIVDRLQEEMDITGEVLF